MKEQETQKNTPTENHSAVYSPAPKNTLITAILVAAVLIAGALVFLGVSLSKGGSTQSFEEQLMAYQEQQQQQQIADQEAQQKLQEEQAKGVLPPNSDDHILGNSEAKITLIEYSDFECPYCKQFAKTPKQIVDNNDGLVNSVFRHFPLGFHDPLATTEAIASECVADLGGNDAFWNYHDRIFETTNSNGNGLQVSMLTTLAGQVGVDTNTFQTCLDSRKFAQEVEDDIASGVSAGVNGTPGNIIRNNETGEVRVLAGAYPIELVQQAIDELNK